MLPKKKYVLNTCKMVEVTECIYFWAHYSSSLVSMSILCQQFSRYSLRSGAVILSAYDGEGTIWGLLCFQVSFRIVCLFQFCRECHQNFDKAYVQSVSQLLLVTQTFLQLFWKSRVWEVCSTFSVFNYFLQYLKLFIVEVFNVLHYVYSQVFYSMKLL